MGLRWTSLLLLVNLVLDPCDVTRVERQKLPRIGIIVPHTRSDYWWVEELASEYEKHVANEEKHFTNDSEHFSNDFEDITVWMPYIPKIIILPELNSSVIDILNAFCEKVVAEDLDILFVTVGQAFGSSTQVDRYLIHFATYLDIPIFSWNQYLMGVEQKISKNIVQMSLPLKLQSQAILDVMRMHSWHQFAIVTTYALDHEEFVQFTKDNIRKMKNEYRFTLLTTIQTDPIGNENRMYQQLKDLRYMNVRIFVLYCTRPEALVIFKEVQWQGMYGQSHQWILASPAFGEDKIMERPSFPLGTIAVYASEWGPHGMIDLLKNTALMFLTFQEMLDENSQDDDDCSSFTHLCNGTEVRRCRKTERLISYFKTKKDELIAFSDVREIQLYVNEEMHWDMFDYWTPGSWLSNRLPSALVENYHLKVAFLEEPPFVIVRFPVSTHEECKEREVECLVHRSGVDSNTTMDFPSDKRPKRVCCGGFIVELLMKLVEDLNFTYELVEVEDGKWGAEVDGQWNGLVGTLLNGRADMAMTSFSISSSRSKVVDFSVPFMETGTAVVAARRTRTRIFTPEAFFQYFDILAWIMILVVSLHITAFAIVFFEWLSPSVYNRSRKRPKGYRFSILRSYWLVWADLLGASVTVVCPRSPSARLMTCVWATFAIVFLATYTAKWTTLMLTEEEYLSLRNVNEKSLSLPNSTESILRYGTVPNGHTDSILKIRHPEVHRYIQQFNRSSVEEGIRALKNGDLDGFIYDSAVLDYLVSKEENCTLLKMDVKMSLTGYGIGFPRKSIHLNTFNQALLRYRADGDLERLQKFWLSGKCLPTRDDGPRILPLSLIQYTNAFVFLLLGILFSGFFLVVEHLVHIYIRKYPVKNKNDKEAKQTRASFGPNSEVQF